MLGAAPSAAAADSPPPGEEPGTAPPPGSEPAFEFQDPRIRESSGLVASQVHEDVYYTHNDSGPHATPEVFAVNTEGETVATFLVTGAGVEARDWEAIAIGEGPDGDPAIHVGDIGDNFGGAWPDIRVYRFAEPRRLVDQEVAATTLTFAYEDGGRDAEGMFIDPRDNRLYVTSKEVAGGLYAAPEEISAEGVNTLRRVGSAPVFATGASVAPDGDTYLVRTYWAATVYDASDGVPGEVVGTLALPRQEQGEGIAHTPEGAAVLVSSEGQHTTVWRVALPEEYGGAAPDEHAADAAVDPDTPPPGSTPADEDASSHAAEPSGPGRAILIGAAGAVLAIAAIAALARRA